MCGYIMTVDMYDITCVVAEFVSIEVHMQAEVVDVFTMTLMYGKVMEERIETTVCKAFSRGSMWSLPKLSRVVSQIRSLS